jgi:hypothetical protein
VEYWSIGVVEWSLEFHYSNTPLLHYSKRVGVLE